MWHVRTRYLMNIAFMHLRCYRIRCVFLQVFYCLRSSKKHWRAWARREVTLSLAKGRLQLGSRDALNGICRWLCISRISPSFVFVVAHSHLRGHIPPPLSLYTVSIRNHTYSRSFFVNDVRSPSSPRRSLTLNPHVGALCRFLQSSSLDKFLQNIHRFPLIAAFALPRCVSPYPSIRSPPICVAALQPPLPLRLTSGSTYARCPLHLSMLPFSHSFCRAGACPQ